MCTILCRPIIPHDYSLHVMHVLYFYLPSIAIMEVDASVASSSIRTTGSREYKHFLRASLSILGDL